MDHLYGYKVATNPELARRAASSLQGRRFMTAGRVQDAVAHLAQYENDVCLFRTSTTSHSSSPHDGGTPTTMKLLIGGPIPAGTALDVTTEDFNYAADSFDVGQMTSLVKEWFYEDFKKVVCIHVLESGKAAVVGPNTKLISLSRQTPGLLDMAATDDGQGIGQYNDGQVIAHSGDMHSQIGGVTCLHHEMAMLPLGSKTRLYFLVGYSNLPLKSWRDSRVFWIVYDPDVDVCWLVPHNLSQEAVGETVSASMPLVSIANHNNENGTTTTTTLTVLHLAAPVQESLASASPLQPNSAQHGAYLRRCLDAASAIDWSVINREAATATTTSFDANSDNQVVQSDSEDPSTNKSTAASADLPSIDRTIAVFDQCNNTIFQAFQIQPISGTCNALSYMHGPLKVLARGCCANSRVVVMDGQQVFAASDVNLVATQLSGVILVQSDAHPDIYKLHQIRWNVARGARTAVLALTADGTKHLCGPLPPSIQIEDYPTPVAGIDVSDELVKQLIAFALSAEGDAYFGDLYQPIPGYEEVAISVDAFIDKTKAKDFRVIVDENAPMTEESFTDADFCQLMETINLLSVSGVTAIERNTLAVRIVKFLKKSSKQVVNDTLASDESLAKAVANLEFLRSWKGDDLDWAVEHKGVLDVLLKNSSISIAPEEGVVDLALQTKLTVAIDKEAKVLHEYIAAKKINAHNSIKKAFNRVFNPALEALMRSIGDNPRYTNIFPEIKTAKMAGIIIRATQSTNK
jgi:hypothetical protein